MGLLEAACFFLHGFSFLGSLQKFSPKKHTTPTQCQKLQDEAEAHQELLHFQNAYPSDPRAFFSTRRARQVGTSVLQRLRTKFPARERDLIDVGVYCTGVPKRVRQKEGLNCGMLWKVVFFLELKIHRHP